MLDKLKNELNSELKKEIQEKSQVVYILSLVRKILEIENKPKYKVLKFYCDWALHSKIDRSSNLIREKLTEEEIHNVYTLAQFTKEFTEFLKEEKLLTDVVDNDGKKDNFRKILSQIYLYTPLIIETIEKEEIIFEKINLDGNSHSAIYTKRKL